MDLPKPAEMTGVSLLRRVAPARAGRSRAHHGAD
jgi:hypothetical protein